jgi:hypothetical protein
MDAGEGGSVTGADGSPDSAPAAAGGAGGPVCRQAGDQGLVHRGRGKPSNRRMAESVKATVLTLYEKQ